MVEVVYGIIFLESIQLMQEVDADKDQLVVE